MWRFFDCLVDGITVLEHGLEFETNSTTGEIIPTSQSGYQSSVHFDLKPENSIWMDRPNLAPKEMNTLTLAQSSYPTTEKAHTLQHHFTRYDGALTHEMLKY